ncbi:MAG: hypothetical protein ACFNL1_04530, partial [Prevotella histicola]
ENLICLHSKQNNNEVSAHKDRHIIHTKQLRNRRKINPNHFSTTHQEESQQPQSTLEREKGNTGTQKAQIKHQIDTVAPSISAHRDVKNLSKDRRKG